MAKANNNKINSEETKMSITRYQKLKRSERRIRRIARSTGKAQGSVQQNEAIAAFAFAQIS
jgi:hypothetical protein